MNNYYPFGMPEAGRSWSYQGEIFRSVSQYQDYTYGFNGMQRDNATGTGSGYTTLFREYDPEIARWKSLDPKLKDFPSESPFSAMGNNPIMNTDVLGDKMTPKNLSEEQKKLFNSKLSSAKEIFKDSPTGMSHIETAESEHSEIEIYVFDDNEVYVEDVDQNQVAIVAGDNNTRSQLMPFKSSLEYYFANKKGQNVTLREGKKENMTDAKIESLILYDVKTINGSNESDSYIKTQNILGFVDEIMHSSQINLGIREQEHINFYGSLIKEIEIGIFKPDEELRKMIYDSYNRAVENRNEYEKNQQKETKKGE